MNTFKNAQKDAINRIRESIDNGKGVLVWAPTPILEFGIITGYDDNEEIFSVCDCVNENPDPMLYSNLGKSEVPILYMQRILDHVQLDPEKIYRESLEFGRYQWQKEHFNAHYACGKKAYSNLLGMLNEDDYHDFGLTYIMAVYADSKNGIAKYLDFLVKNSKELSGLEQATSIYMEIAKCFKGMSEIAPFKGPMQAAVDKTRIPEMIEFVKKAEDLETTAMEIIGTVLDD
jgi:hypothetical protein